MDDPFHRVFRRLVDCIQGMAKDASKDGMLFGLRGFPEFFRGRPTTRWEQTITKTIAEQCDDCIQTKEPRYPDDVIPLIKLYNLPRGQKRSPKGDLRISLKNDPIPIFVECKSIFECVLQRFKEKPIEHNGRYYGYDYGAKDENILTDPKSAQTCVSIEEAKIDARKLNCLWERKHFYHLGLLLLEFDRKGHEIDNRGDYQDLEKYLGEDGWSLIGRESWPDMVPVRAKKDFQEHVVLWVKRPQQQNSNKCQE